jgi:ABC-type polysaccharide/polyol phosphate export permease
MTMDRLARLGDLIAMLVYRDIRVRYKRAWLGMIWSLATPLSMAIVFTLVFRVIMKTPIPLYPIYALAGLYPWMFFQRALVTAMTSFQLSADIIRQTPAPRIALPLAAVLVEAFHLLGAFLLLALLVPALGGPIGPAWIQLPFVFLFTVAYASGLGMILAPLQHRYRDTRYLVELGLVLLFYAAPIIYRPEMAPEAIRRWIDLNPAALVVLPYRHIIYEGLFLTAGEWAFLAAHAAIALVIGVVTIKRLGRDAADYV